MWRLDLFILLWEKISRVLILKKEKKKLEWFFCCCTLAGAHLEKDVHLWHSEVPPKRAPSRQATREECTYAFQIIKSKWMRATGQQFNCLNNSSMLERARERERETGQRKRIHALSLSLLRSSAFGLGVSDWQVKDKQRAPYSTLGPYCTCV